jgi:hypothetical protein
MPADRIVHAQRVDLGPALGFLFANPKRLSETSFGFASLKVHRIGTPLEPDGFTTGLDSLP